MGCYFVVGEVVLLLGMVTVGCLEMCKECSADFVGFISRVKDRNMVIVRRDLVKGH